jgi:hypothetical protein
VTDPRLQEAIRLLRDADLPGLAYQLEAREIGPEEAARWLRLHDVTALESKALTLLDALSKPQEETVNESRPPRIPSREVRYAAAMKYDQRIRETGSSRAPDSPSGSEREEPGGGQGEAMASAFLILAERAAAHGLASTRMVLFLAAELLDRGYEPATLEQHLRALWANAHPDTGEKEILSKALQILRGGP